MRAMLRTLCGSTRIVEIENPHLGYKIALPAVVNFAKLLEEDPSWVPEPPKTRSFVYTGDIPVLDEQVS